MDLHLHRVHFLVIFATIYYDVSRSKKHIQYSRGCFSRNEDDYNIRRRSSLLMLLLYSGPEGPSTRKMFRLNILECRLQFTVSETTKGKWLQYGDILHSKRMEQDGKERALYR